MLKRLSLILFFGSFVSIFVFGLVFSVLFKQIVGDPWAIQDLSQVLLMAIMLSGGFLLGFRVKTKRALTFLETSGDEITLPCMREKKIPSANIDFDTLVGLIEQSGMIISFKDEQVKQLKFHEKFKLEKGNLQTIGATISLKDQQLHISVFAIYKDNMLGVERIMGDLESLFRLLEK